MRESDDEERAILEALENGVSDTDLAAMLRDLAAVLRGKGGHIGACVVEIVADRLTMTPRQD